MGRTTRFEWGESRPGHKSSGRFEKGFEPEAKILSIDGGVRNHALLAMVVVPLPASGPQNGAIDRDRSPAGLPGIDQIDQQPAQAANLGRQALRQPFEAPFPGLTGRKAFSLAQQCSKGFHLSRWLAKNREQFMNRSPITDTHNHQRFQKQTIRIDGWPTSPSFSGLWGRGKTVNQLDQADKQRVLTYQRNCLRVLWEVAIAMIRSSLKLRQALSLGSSL